MKTKWYWWVPIVGLFFVEEITGWVYDSEGNERTKRMVTYSYLWGLHLISFPIFITLYILMSKM